MRYLQILCLPACLQGPYIEACKAKVQEIMRAAEEVHEQAITRMVGGCQCHVAVSECCCGRWPLWLPLLVFVAPHSCCRLVMMMVMCSPFKLDKHVDWSAHSLVSGTCGLL